MIVTVVRSPSDGTVVRWYRTLTDAATQRPIVTASRRGVRCDAYLHQVPGEVLRAADDVRAALSRDPLTDLSHLATHTTRPATGSMLIPIGDPDGGEG